MVADALAPYVPRSSEAVVLTSLPRERISKQPAPYEGRGMIGNSMFLRFIK